MKKAVQGKMKYNLQQIKKKYIYEIKESNKKKKDNYEILSINN